MLTHPRQDHPRFASFSHVDDLPSTISLKKWFQASASTFWYVLDRERPLQLRLRTIYSIVTKSDNFYTNLYQFSRVSSVFKTIFLFFTLPWLFGNLMFIPPPAFGHLLLSEEENPRVRRGLKRYCQVALSVRRGLGWGSSPLLLYFWQHLPSSATLILYYFLLHH